MEKQSIPIVCTKLQILVVHPCTNPPREVGAGQTWLAAFLGPCSGSGCLIMPVPVLLLPGEEAGSHNGFAACCTPAGRVVDPQGHGSGLWEHQAERPLWGLLIVVSFPVPVLGNSVAPTKARSFCDTRILRPYCPI